MRRIVSFASAALLALALAACSDDQPMTNNQSSDQTLQGSKQTESFNQRMKRQSKLLPTINRNQLPAPEGNAATVALKAINDNAMKSADKCKAIKRAERFDSDGSIIATCRNGQDYRIFRVEGILSTFALKCKSAREKTAIDPCDADLVRSGHDDSVDRVLSFIAKV